ncbi:biotin--[acetyl-CoA-carboxylase] ligase [Acidovorax sp. Be4]|uniref:biotin--[biotin carboxyl-carrier protein] ligase n=1 Tax=Acidovorax bellezanensis TaxID=2976702 RepID=A0ABT2PMA7_9BURK|nr:biotin--[acetyl-CoA-carboxylase] ligase [Acidovorax sp. Be4]MCT9811604.1 biotin--[acetyl-CoA-carboxylase] ligase [Acidovorax sp. Be4]
MTFAPSPIRWPAEALWQAVSPLLEGFTVEILPAVDSTNTELMRRARAGRCEPILLVTESQTAGRGRLGRDWVSQVGDSLTFSLGLPMAPVEWSGLSLAVGVSVAQSLQPQLPAAGDAAPRVGLKWPNDLWLTGDRKLGGILIETASGMSAAGPARYVVIGVGLNVRPPDGQGLRTAPASLGEVDPALDAPTALGRIVPPLVQALQAFAQHGFAAVRPQFAQRDLLQGRIVNLSDGSSGLAQGVGPDGALLVQTATGLLEVTSSEISVRPQPASAA